MLKKSKFGIFFDLRLDFWHGIWNYIGRRQKNIRKLLVRRDCPTTKTIFYSPSKTFKEMKKTMITMMLCLAIAGGASAQEVKQEKLSKEQKIAQMEQRTEQRALKMAEKLQLDSATTKKFVATVKLNHQEMMKARQKCDARMARILSPEQMKQLKAMKCNNGKHKGHHHGKHQGKQMHNPQNAKFQQQVKMHRQMGERVQEAQAN